MEDYSLSVKPSPWTGNIIRTVIIEPGVTSIGATAFYCIYDIKTLLISTGLSLLFMLLIHRRKGKKHSNNKRDVGGESKTPL